MNKQSQHLENVPYVLTKNKFNFNGKHFLQVEKSALGTKVAPSFANLFIEDLEDKWVYNYSTHPSVWLRYIDTIFILREDTKE